MSTRVILKLRGVEDSEVFTEVESFDLAGAFVAVTSPADEEGRQITMLVPFELTERIFIQTSEEDDAESVSDLLPAGEPPETG